MKPYEGSNILTQDAMENWPGGWTYTGVTEEVALSPNSMQSQYTITLSLQIKRVVEPLIGRFFFPIILLTTTYLWQVAWTPSVLSWLVQSKGEIAACTRTVFPFRTFAELATGFAKKYQHNAQENT